MAELSLYRKYRPHNFQNLVGQDHIRTTLLNATKRDALSHAYLFCGPRGTGKTSTARLVAKVLNCLDLQDDFEPCNKCEICEGISIGRLIDIIEIDAASNRGIDEMRELKDKIDFAPTTAKTKVYIIDEVHMLTKEAFNALLKTLEEPPAHAYFILATTEVHKIPETIISRCQRFDFQRITEKTIMTRLNYIAQLEKIEVEDGAIELIAHYVDGGMRDAIGLLEQLSTDNKLTQENVCRVLGMSDQEEIEKLYNFLVDYDTSSALTEAQNIHSHGHDMAQFLKSFLEFVRMKMLAELSSNADSLRAAWFLKLIDTFQIASQQLRVTVIPQLPLEMAIVKFCGAADAPISATPESAVTAKAQARTEAKKSKMKVEEIKREMPVKAAKVQTAEEIKSGFRDLPHENPAEEKAEASAAKPVEKSADENAKETPKQAPVKGLDLASVKKELPRVMEHVLQPSVRRSLQTANLIEVNGNVIVFEFSALFHQQKVLDHENRVQIEKSFEDVFGQAVKLEGKLKKVDLEPALSDSSNEHEMHGESASESEAEPVAQTDGKPQQKKDLADIAADMFGGEFIED